MVLLSKITEYKVLSNLFEYNFRQNHFAYVLKKKKSYEHTVTLIIYIFPQTLNTTIL